MTFKKKVRLLNEYDHKTNLSAKDFKRLLALAGDKEKLIRSMTAAVLSNFVNIDSEKVLLKLACDKSSLVRAESYDSLSSFDSTKVQKFLKKAILREKNEIAWAYAVIAWAEISAHKKKQYEFLKEIKNLAKSKKSEHCLLSFYYAKYLLQNKKIEKILNFLNSEDYHIRCSAINLLWNIISTENKDLIAQALENLLIEESCASVSDNANKLLSFINTM